MGSREHSELNTHYENLFWPVHINQAGDLLYVKEILYNSRRSSFDVKKFQRR